MPLTANECAQRFLITCRALGQTRVPNTELHDYISRTTGQSRKVVSGTLDGTGGQTLINSDWYLRDWHKTRQSGRVIHCLRAEHTGAVVEREMDYDFPEKRRIINKVISYLPKTGSPNFLTMAGAQGNCVQAALRWNPKVKVESVESSKLVLDLWKETKSKLGVDCVDYCCKFQKFVQTPGFQLRHYGLIYDDAMGYMSKTMYRTLNTLNNLKNASIIAITVQRLEEFRNGRSPFQEKLRRLYRNCEDKHAQSITDCLSNYQMVYGDTYQKDVGTIEMEILIYRLKTPEEIADETLTIHDEQIRKQLLKLC